MLFPGEGAGDSPLPYKGRGKGEGWLGIPDRGQFSPHLTEAYRTEASATELDGLYLRT